MSAHAPQAHETTEPQQYDTAEKQPGPQQAGYSRFGVQDSLIALRRQSGQLVEKLLTYRARRSNPVSNSEVTDGAGGVAVADLSRKKASGSALSWPRRPTTCTYGAGLSRARAARCRAWADSLPENRLHGVIAGKLYTYASDARVRRWPNGIEITGKGTPA